MRDWTVSPSPTSRSHSLPHRGIAFLRGLQTAQSQTMPPPSLQTTLLRLQTLKRWLLTVTSAMGTSSPTEVLHNLVRILEGASPHLRLAIALTTPWAMLVGALASYGRVWQGLRAVKSYVGGSVYASVRIPGTHALQKQVLAYVVEQGLGKNARSLTLSPAQRDHKQLMMNYMTAYDNIYGHGARALQKQRHTEPDEKEKPPLSYVPQVGTYAFWWRGNRITLRQESREYEERDSRGKYHFVMATVADIELSCISLLGGAGPLRDFLKVVQNIPMKERTTTIYRPQARSWDAGIVQSSRNLNAVTMNSSVKDSLVKDVETYLAPATKKYYANRGIPYRRGFLFYGPPGTGKTSFANAIAGHFNLSVYMISLSTKTLSDDMLEGLFEQLPNKCIVLLEDIDSAGIKRENMRATKKRAKRTKREAVDEYGEPIYVRAAGITLSGLLNVLDGIHSREGIITIMTSNTPDSLDPALVRPGRVDRKVLFSFASAEVSAKLFRHIFEKTAEERVEGEAAEGGKHDIAALAARFADAIPADRLTPGDVQGFLLVHRADPEGAVGAAKAWAERTLAIKATGANVAAFEGAAVANTEPAAAMAGADRVARDARRNDSAHEEEDDTSENSTRSTGAPPDGLRGLPAMSYPSNPWSPAYGGGPMVSYRPSPYGGSQPTGYASHVPPARFDGGFNTLMTAGPPAHQTWGLAGRFGTAVAGQPTPPYSRSASRSSRSPPTTDDASEKAGDGAQKTEEALVGNGEKKDSEK